MSTPQTKEYKAFIHARYRCTNPECDVYMYYGGRGIQFKFETFEQFLVEVGLAPSVEHQLDRKDNDKHYEPGNVHWVTKAAQMTNKRQRPSNSGHRGISWNARDRIYTVFVKGKYVGIRKDLESALQLRKEKTE